MSQENPIEINKYVRWIQEGKSFADVREDLKSIGVPEEDIKGIIVKVDDELLNASINNQKDSQQKFFDTVWKIIMAIGVGLIVAYFVFDSMTFFSLGITCVASAFAIILFKRKIKDGRAPGLDRERRKLNLKRD